MESSQNITVKRSHDKNIARQKSLLLLQGLLCKEVLTANFEAYD